MLKKNEPVVPSGPGDRSHDELAKEVEEDIAAQRTLREALSRPPGPMVTEQSIRDGEKFMARMRRRSKAALLSRIKRGELITKDALIVQLGGSSRWFTAALKAERVFSVVAPSGVDYFPSFFADASYDRRALGRVVQALAGLPGQSKYSFFTTKFLSLGMTPLQALAEGRTKDVLYTALGFTER